MARRPGTGRSRLGLWQFFGHFQSLCRRITWLELGWAGLLGGTHWRGGIRGLLVGQCGQGRPADLLVEIICCSFEGIYLCIHIYYDIVASVRHCGWF